MLLSEEQLTDSLGPRGIGMRLRNSALKFGAVASFAMIATPGAADIHIGKLIYVIQVDVRPCVFFTLIGAPTADASLPAAGPWFSLPNTHPNFAQINAIILSAKLAGRPITVETSATVECGHAGITRVNVDP